MPDQDFYDNLRNFGFATMAAASQPAATTLGAIGQGGIGMNQAALQAQQTKAAQLQNQMGMLNLQRAQAMQPMVMNQIKGMSSNSNTSNGGTPASGTSSPASAYAQQALMAAMASGNQEQISKAYLSLYEHDPDLAGQIKGKQEDNTWQKMPDGTYRKLNAGLQAGASQPSSPAGYNSTSSSAGGEPPNNQTRTAPSTAQGISNDDAPAQPVVLTRKDAFPVTRLGNPVIKGYQRLAPPDPGGVPSYNTPNTNDGQNVKSEFLKADIAADKSLGDSASNANQMLSRLHDMTDAYKSGQAGTLIAQHPDIANKMIAMGVITNKGVVNDVAQFQIASADQIVEILNQIKAASAGTSQSRILNSEIQAFSSKMADPSQRPEAIKGILGMATGLANYNQDLAQGWNDIGGLGNHVVQGKYTMRPDAYQRQFSLNNSIDDYVKQAKQNMGELKGMVNPIPKDGQTFSKKFPDGTVHKIMVKGGQLVDFNTGAPIQ